MSLKHEPNDEEISVATVEEPDIDYLLDPSYLVELEQGNEAPSFEVVALPGKREGILAVAEDAIQDIDILTVAGKKPRITQKSAVFSFYEWVLKRQFQREMMGHIIQPPGAGKTNLSILLSQMVPGKVMVIALRNKEKIFEAFVDHEKMFKKDERRKIGRCYGKFNETDSDVLIALFASSHKWGAEIDWEEVDLVLVDEADINGLSKERALFLRHIAAEYSIPVIATTATEHQASGRQLKDVFPDEIDRIGLPEDLPKALELGIVSPMRFHDLWLEGNMELAASDVEKKEIPDEAVTEFIKSSPWVEAILADYETRSEGYGGFRKGVIIFRDNNLLGKCLELCAQKGIKVAAYYGPLTDEERLECQAKLVKGELDLLIGSELLGRGVHIPGISIVYNSTIRRSPQSFWQADGRGASPNEKDPGQVVDIIAVLPKTVVNGLTGKVLPLPLWPLSHAAFFDPNYYLDDNKLQPKTFDLREAKQIRSVEEVIGIRNKLLEHPAYSMNRPQLLAQFIASLDTPITFSLLIRMTYMRAERLYDFIEATQPKEDLSKLSFDQPIDPKAEFKLVLRAKDGDRNALGKIIEIYSPLITSMARNMQVPNVDLDELLSVASEAIVRLFKGDVEFKGRILTYIMMTSFNAIARFIACHRQNVRIPVRRWDIMAQREASFRMRIQALMEKTGDDLTEQEYLRAINLAYEEIKIIEKLGGLENARKLLEIHKRAHNYLSVRGENPSTLKKEKLEQAAAELADYLDISPADALLALKINSKSAMLLELIFKHISDIEADAPKRKALMDHWPHAYADDFENLADVGSNTHTQDALLAAQDSVRFNDGRFADDSLVFDEVHLDKLLVASKINNALAQLPNIKREILTLRFGLDDQAEELGFKEIGDLYKLSRERIRQIQNEAIVAMRKLLKIK